MRRHTASSLDYEGDATRMPKQPLKPWRRLAVSQVAELQAAQKILNESTYILNDMTFTNLQILPLSLVILLN
jgi:hypothetical protein